MMKRYFIAISMLLVSVLQVSAAVLAGGEHTVKDVRLLNPTTVEILYQNGQSMTVDFYGEQVFRLFQDNKGGIIRAPQATPLARILVDHPRKPVGKLQVGSNDLRFTVVTVAVRVDISRDNGLLSVTDLRSGKTGALQAPSLVRVADTNITPYSLKPSWQPVANADYYEVEYDGMNYSTVRDTCLLFTDLTPETDYLQPSGKLSVTTDKAVYEAGDDVAVTVKGTDLKGVNALNVMLPYNERDLQFVKVEPLAVKDHATPSTRLAPRTSTMTFGGLLGVAALVSTPCY